MNVPDELWQQIVAFVAKIDGGEATIEYMEGDIYEDAEKILEQIANLEQ